LFEWWENRSAQGGHAPWRFCHTPVAAVDRPEFGKLDPCEEVVESGDDLDPVMIV
jgi:hypothetical protein